MGFRRQVLLISVLAGLVSLGVIGHALFKSWFAIDARQTAWSQPMPPPKGDRPKSPDKQVEESKSDEPVPEREVVSAIKETAMPADAPVKAAMTPPEQTVDSPAENESAILEKEQAAPNPDTDATVESEDKNEASETPSAEKTPVKPEKTKPVQKPKILASKTAVLPHIEDFKGTQTIRPYEEKLPADIYEPPDFKIPKHKPKPPKARRLKKKSKGDTVKKKRLSALARSQLPPWRRFAARVVDRKKNAGKPKIVIVIDDLGIDRKRTAKVIALKAPMTLSFLTYARRLRKQTRLARKAGHEILIHVAMEPDNMKNDPGPRVLLRDLEPAEIQRRLEWGLGRITRYVGINNHMGSKFTSDPYGMTIVMKELGRRGLLFLDSRTTNKSVGAVIAHAFEVPYAERNIFLDNVNKIEAVQDRLAELEGIARRRGKAIAIGHPRDATIQALENWIKDVQTRGFAIVPLTAVVRAPKSAG